MDGFVYDALPARVVFGSGAARTRLAGEVDRIGATAVLLIASDRAADLVNALVEPFAERISARFSAVREHVPVATAEAARAAGAGADAVLCIGGGSAIGAAKAVALTARIPIIAVPTTYSGSEMTPIWGLTEAGRKVTGVDLAVLPKVVVYDPELTASMPPELATASGLNAMAHGVEALWAPGRNPVSSVLAEDGIAALATGLRGLAPYASGPALTSGGGAQGARDERLSTGGGSQRLEGPLARRSAGGGHVTELLRGAWLSAAAFAVAGSGLHHKLAHTLGGTFELPHARTHAVLLPHVLAFNAPGAPEAAARVARALGVDDAARGLRALADQLGVPHGLRELGLREDQIDEAADLTEPAVPKDNPVPVGDGALRRLVRTAWSGEPGGGLSG